MMGTYVWKSGRSRSYAAGSGPVAAVKTRKVAKREGLAKVLLDSGSAVGDFGVKGKSCDQSRFGPTKKRRAYAFGHVSAPCGASPPVASTGPIPSPAKLCAELANVIIPRACA